MLSCVVRVDANVLVGKVGGPEGAGSVALMQINCDGKLRLLDVGMCCVFVVFLGPAAVAADGQIAERDVDGFWVDCSAGVADGGHEASPVRIATRPGGLGKRRMRDGLGNAQRVGIRSGALDAEFD